MSTPVRRPGRSPAHDTQKQTAYAYAKSNGLLSIEEYAWERAIVDGSGHDYTWIRKGQEVRTSAITVDAEGEWVVGRLKDMVILKSTGSEFAGFLTDEYTILAPTHDRVMATSPAAQWRFSTSDVDWDATYTAIKTQLVEQFAVVQSLALQQTLFEKGKAVLETYPSIAEVRLSARTAPLSSTTCRRSACRTTARSTTPTSGPTD